MIQSGKCEPPGGVLNPLWAKSEPPWAINEPPEGAVEPPGGSQVRKSRGFQPSAKPKSKENRFDNEKNYQCPYKNNGDGVVPFLWLPIHPHTLCLLTIGGKHIRRDELQRQGYQRGKKDDVIQIPQNRYKVRNEVNRR